MCIIIIMSLVNPFDLIDFLVLVTITNFLIIIMTLMLIITIFTVMMMINNQRILPL